MIEWYTIVVDAENKDKLHWGSFSDTASLGKDGRLCVSSNGLQLNTLELAEKLIERYTSLLKNKYGNETEIYVRKSKYLPTPVYGKKTIEKIKNDSDYAEDVLKNGKEPKVTKIKDIKEGWIVIVKKEGMDKLYTMPIKKKGIIEVTTDKQNAKIYQRLNAAKKYAEKINQIKGMTALVIETKK